MKLSTGPVRSDDQRPDLSIFKRGRRDKKSTAIDYRASSISQQATIKVPQSYQHFRPSHHSHLRKFKVKRQRFDLVGVDDERTTGSDSRHAETSELRVPSAEPLIAGHHHPRRNSILGYSTFRTRRWAITEQVGSYNGERPRSDQILSSLVRYAGFDP